MFTAKDWLAILGSVLLVCLISAATLIAVIWGVYFGTRLVP